MKKKTFAEMAQIVRDIRNEVKRRNPLGVNLYRQPLDYAAAVLDEISYAEKIARTAEHGPKER